MRAVNLLPKEIQRASAQKPVGPVLIGGVALLLCGAVLYKSRADADQKIVDRQADIAAIVKAPVKTPPSYTPGQQAAADQEAPRITALDSALKNARAVGQRPPPDLARRPGRRDAPDAHADGARRRRRDRASRRRPAPGVTIVGSSYSQDGVARLLARLDVVAALTNVQLATSGVQTSTTADSGGSSAAADSGIVYVHHHGRHRDARGGLVNVQIGQSTESRQQIVYYVGALAIALVVLAGGWFTYVKPASAKASFLAARETDAAERGRVCGHDLPGGRPPEQGAARRPLRPDARDAGPVPDRGRPRRPRPPRPELGRDVPVDRVPLRACRSPATRRSR